MHDLDVIHGNLKIVRLPFFFRYPHEALISSQDNILVDLYGTARIGGLGSAFVASRNHATWSEMDAKLSLHGTAPESVRPNPLESGIRTTKESDVYAFALLAWEVSCLPLILFRTFANPYPPAFRQTGSFFSHTPGSGDQSAGRRYSTASTLPPRALRSGLEGDRNVLAS